MWQGGAQIGAGAGAASALHSVLSRVVCARGANGALAALRAVCGVWRRDADAGHAYDLQATLLRLALPMLQVLSPRHVHHALPLMLTVGQCLPFYLTRTLIINLNVLQSAVIASAASLLY